MSKLERTMTPAEYASKGGCVCPQCGSHEITGLDIDFEGSHIFQQISCDECDATWVDNYVLIGYGELEDGDFAE